MLFPRYHPLTAEPLQVHRFTFENHSYVGCTTDKANHTQGHPWCHLECIHGKGAKNDVICSNTDANKTKDIFFLVTYQSNHCKPYIIVQHMPRKCDESTSLLDIPAIERG